ncbi:hypothetical protein AncyloWKF20_17000 [Ancylobacter sp. WKF20]|uniref:hypothetical protein n=1 Tax=Ancylobacter sp. WKF20 TaxID=3039801 RepID=UPI00243422D9|nr:hypothetical protein [Ancylobacter sp. WKF20]WGD29453.1 hypothetical protein AncyloWKF20_17000 [Ancylobacter sp. WKF20]
MSSSLPVTPDHLPFFITAPGGTDFLLGMATATLIGAVLVGGVLFLALHSLPERMAHKAQKLQMEIVAVLCLLALFTHIHLFWVAALLLAFIDLPDFGTPLTRIARGVERLAGASPPAEAPPPETPAGSPASASRPHA